MGKGMLCAGAIVSVLSALPLQAADRQQDRLVEQVIALTDACQRHALVAQVQAGLASQGQRLDLGAQPAADVLAVFAWQQHLFYVYAGLAEQWTVAQWSREGTALAGRLRNGELDWTQAQPALRDWQQRAAAMPPAPDGCGAAPLPRQVRRLGRELVGWIVPAARRHAASTAME